MTIKQRPIGHMPFAGHRTQKVVREDEERARRLEREWSGALDEERQRNAETLGRVVAEARAA